MSGRQQHFPQRALTFAKNNGLKFDLWLPKDASISETVLKKAQEKLVNVRRF